MRRDEKLARVVLGGLGRSEDMVHTSWRWLTTWRWRVEADMATRSAMGGLVYLIIER